jgi:hypothetical protein
LASNRIGFSADRQCRIQRYVELMCSPLLPPRPDRRLPTSLQQLLAAGSKFSSDFPIFGSPLEFARCDSRIFLAPSSNSSRLGRSSFTSLPLLPLRLWPRVASSPFKVPGAVDYRPSLSETGEFTFGVCRCRLAERIEHLQAWGGRIQEFDQVVVLETPARFVAWFKSRGGLAVSTDSGNAVVRRCVPPIARLVCLTRWLIEVNGIHVHKGHGMTQRAKVSRGHR